MKKVAGGRRTPQCQGKTATNRLVHTSLASHRGSAGTRGFHRRTAGPRSETSVKAILTRQRRGDAAPLAADQDAGGLDAMPAIAAVDQGECGPRIGQDLDLFEGRCQGVAVMGIAGKAAGANYEAANKGRGEADLGAELVSHPRLAFGDAIDLGLVQGIDLVAALWSLLQQAADQPEGVHNPLAQGALRDFLQVPAQIAAHPADIAPELAQRLAHALELAGMGVTTDLDRQSRGKTGIALAQIDPGPLRQTNQQGAGPLVEPGIRRMGDVLFHDRRIDHHPFQDLVANLPALLDASGLEHRCLFKGGTAEELAEVAPWLVRLTEDSRLTRLLFTGKDAIGGLWQSEPGIYIRSRASFEDIWRHFRRFTRVQDECGNWFLFRFWEPRWLEANAAVLGGGSEAAIPSRWPPVRIVQPYRRG